MVASADAPLDWIAILVGVGGGLALFLFGMDQLVLSLKGVAGDRMRGLLARMTTSRWRAVGTGAFVTAVIQSSSVTTVLLVGFLSAGLLTLPQSIGVIFGANIGTTITAQVIAFRVTDWGLAMVALGFALLRVARTEKPRLYGRLLLGLGLVFFGMSLMSGATRPLRDSGPFLAAMQGMRHPAIGLLAGALFTAVVQSSSATTGVAIVLAADGLLGLEAGIALVLGANIGTCVTALVAAAGKPVAARRAAAVHVVFNVAGVLLWVGLVRALAAAVRTLAPDDVARQLAHAHTLFNVGNTLVFVGFAGPLGRFVERTIPDRPPAGRVAIAPRYLDAGLLATPALALDAVRRELVRTAGLAREMVELARPLAARLPADAAGRIDRRHAQVAVLHAAVVEFLSTLVRGRIERRHADEAAALLTIAHNLENLSGAVRRDVLALIREASEHGVAASAPTRAMLREIHREVLAAYADMQAALADSDTERAFAVVRREDELRAMAERATEHLLDRLGADEPKRALTWRLESGAIELLRRLFQYERNIARAVVQGAAKG